MSPVLNLKDTRQAPVGQAITLAANRLADEQDGSGFWCGLLTADTTLDSDYILLQLWMHPPDGHGWNPPSRALVDRAVQAILERQLRDGGFNIHVHGPSDVSATVKAYFALKLAGVPVDDPGMIRAKERILALGGIQAANSYVKLNLSLFDLYPREHVPSIPPELILPRGLVYQMSSWTRAIVVALAIVHSSNPRRPVPSGFNLSELFLPGVELSQRPEGIALTWRNFFLRLDRVLKFWERRGSRFLRRRAVAACERWMVERFDASDGLGAIYPPMMYAIMALDVLGYPPDHPHRVEALRQFDNLMVNDGRRNVTGQGFFFQPCFSPIWDTAIAVYSLGEAGLRPAALSRAADWILSKEIRRKGDWAFKRPSVEPSGWAFEFNNEFYPDIDDTAMVLLGLSRAKSTNPAAQRACERRAVNWLLAMQSKDGGWAAFDADNNWEFLSQVPFADHNAMLDPTCADITGRVLEAVCAYGLDQSHAAVKRGVAYLTRTQEADGSWYGRWGVAYIYGTCFALRGLRAAREDDREAHVLRAGEWLRSIQNADGGWGEDCTSYNNRVFTPAESTPSQTA